MSNVTNSKLSVLHRQSGVRPLALAVSLLLALPVLSILFLAFGSVGRDIAAFDVQVLARLALNTALLCVGSAAMTLVIGTLSAWLVAAHEFPGRKVLAWMALLPLAMPGYIIAFVFVDFFDYGGPMQTWLRGAMGWTSPADYSFPQIRSLWGATLTFALVLYPYVYMAGRAAFARLPANQVLAARTLGRGPVTTFFHIVLPQTRPALAIGAALVVMECINDIGSVSFFGVRTFAVAIFTTWLDQGSLGGAAQLSVLVLMVIALLVLLEQYARKQDGLPKTPAMGQRLIRKRLKGGKGWLATAAVGIPVLLGFILPVVLLLWHGFRRFDDSLTQAFLSALQHTVLLAAAAALLVLALALMLKYAEGKAQGAVETTLRFLSNMGYALPGTILAIGVLVPLSRLDHGLNAVTQQMFGVTPGLVLSGTLFALLFAYVVRFYVIASAMVDNGLDKIPKSLGQAARVLGRTPFRAFLDVQLPLLRPALVAGGLMVFVDAMKELPATLLLRPFDFDTLATLTFATASLGQIEQAALPALAIVVAGLIPIYILMSALNDRRV